MQSWLVLSLCRSVTGSLPNKSTWTCIKAREQPGNQGFTWSVKLAIFSSPQQLLNILCLPGSEFSQYQHKSNEDEMKKKVK